MKKIKYIVLFTIIIVMIFPIIIYATQINPEDYNPGKPTTGEVRGMYKYAGSIAGVIRIAGTIVSAGALIVIGIRYVVSSAEERAEYKERLVPYTIGAVLLFGASNIVSIILKFAS